MIIFTDTLLEAFALKYVRSFWEYIQERRGFMYNFMLAFLICCVSYIIGEMVSNLTKAWVPSVFVSAVVMLLGYWTVFPHDLVTNAGLIPFGSTICCYLQVAHMGTIISIKQLAEQWKVIVICMFGLVGMTVLALFCANVLGRKRRYGISNSRHRYNAD